MKASPCRSTDGTLYVGKLNICYCVRMFFSNVYDDILTSLMVVVMMIIVSSDDGDDDDNELNKAFDIVDQSSSSEGCTLGAVQSILEFTLTVLLIGKAYSGNI